MSEEIIKTILQADVIDESSLTLELNKLNQLSLEYMELNNQAKKILMTVLAKNKTIIELKLEHMELGVEGANALADMLTENNTLLNLTLRYLGSKSKRTQTLLWHDKRCCEEAEIIFGALKNNNTLQKLSVYNSDVSAKAVITLADNLLNHRNLTTLVFDYNNLKAKKAEYLISSLERNNVLKHLDISHNSLDDDNIILLTKILKHHKTLSSLHLSNTSIKKEAITAIGDFLLDQNCNLTLLNISYNNITGNELKYIISACSNNTKLLELDLTGNNFGPQGAEIIADGLRSNTTLTNLKIKFNKIGESGRSMLDELRNTHPQLTIETCTKEEEMENEAIVDSVSKIINVAYSTHLHGKGLTLNEDVKSLKDFVTRNTR